MAEESNNNAADHEDSAPEWDSYHLRLFFSADIVGSTAFKQKPETDVDASQGSEPGWFSVVLAFYHQAEVAFNRHWDLYHQKPDREKLGNSARFGQAPEVWKTVGDEVLFTKVISHPMQAMMALHAWCQTLDDLRVFLKWKAGLDVKSCAWLASFPLHNQEVVLGYAKPGADDDYALLNRDGLAAFHNGGSSDKRAMLRDFIGPSIDTGFRLGAHASPRKLVISLELAHLLSTEQAYAEANPGWHSDGPTEIRKFSFRYDGKHILKGVLGGNPYPIFWIDQGAESRLYRTEDDLVEAVKPSALHIRNFTSAFIDEHGKYLSAPGFKRVDGSLDIAHEHAEIDSRTIGAISSRRKHYREAKIKRESENDDISQDNGSDGGQDATAHLFTKKNSDVREELNKIISVLFDDYANKNTKK